jgi:hypothetical protein
MTFIADYSNEFAKKAGFGNKTPVGIGGFTAYATINSDFKLESEVPTSHLEDGSFANDHVVLKPITISMQISVADVFIKASIIREYYAKVFAEIGNVTKYLPDRTNAQLAKVASFTESVANTARKIDTAIQDGQQVLQNFGLFEDDPLRKQFIDAVTKIHATKQLINLEVAYNVIPNMRLTSISIQQDNETEEVRCSIQAQEVRFASTFTESYNQYFQRPSEGTGGKTEGISNKGKQAGKTVETSLATSVKNGVIGSFN